MNFARRKLVLIVGDKYKGRRLLSRETVELLADVLVSGPDEIVLWYKTFGRGTSPIPTCAVRHGTLSKLKDMFTARKRSLGQSNLFTPMCHSVHEGGEGGLAQLPPISRPGGGQTPLGRPHPLDADPQGKPLDADPQANLWMQTPPWGLADPLDADRCRVGQTPPGLGRPPPRVGQTLPQSWADPPGLGRPPHPIRSASGQYASYWNAYLSFYKIKQAGVFCHNL